MRKESRNLKKKKTLNPESLDYRIEKNRAWYICVYDLQGGPIHENAIRSLEEYAQEVAKKYNLAINTKVE